MATSLKLIAASQDMRNLVTAALAEHGIACRSQGNMVIVEGDSDECGAPERVIAMLRDVLSAPEREDISVVEELDYPREFPVTTRLDTWWSVMETSWFDKALAADAFSVWFQPVVDTTARRVIGQECQLRLTTGRRRDGAEIMAAASARRELFAFDSWFRQLALRTIAAQPENSIVSFLNFIPSAIYRPSQSLRDTLETLHESGLEPSSIVMEAVGCNCHPDIGHLRRIGEYFREQGMGFSLDDVGTDADAVRLVCDLRPDYIKLERGVAGRMGQPRQAAAVRRLVDIAGRMKVRVVAKNVECVSSMEQLGDAGIEYMQGYLFGCPAPEMGGMTADLAHLARAIQPAPQPDGAGQNACAGVEERAPNPEWRTALTSLGF